MFESRVVGHIHKQLFTLWAKNSISCHKTHTHTHLKVSSKIKNKTPLSFIHFLVKLSNLVPFFLICTSQKVRPLQSTASTSSAHLCLTHTHWPCSHQDQQGHSSCPTRRSHCSVPVSLRCLSCTRLAMLTLCFSDIPSSRATSLPLSWFSRTLSCNSFLLLYQQLLLDLLPLWSQPINQRRSVNVHWINS